MTTQIINPQNQCISEGRNLDIMFRHARKRGVSRIAVSRISSTGRYEALVNVFYKDGFRAVTNFASFDHAVEWANARSNTGQASAFAGCEVQVTS